MRTLVALGVGGALGVAAGGVVARQGTVGATEQRCFRAVNHLPEAAYPGVWAVMQLGSLGGGLAAAGAVAATGRPSLGARMAVATAAAWTTAKAVKRVVSRPRPGREDLVRLLGAAPEGSGYPSGHAAVAATLAVVAGAGASPEERVVLVGTALVVGAARVYVGAHLPLDVAGGLALGAAVGSVAVGRGGPG